MDNGCLDGCFGWLGHRCSGLTVEEPIEHCRFYKHAETATEDRLASLDTAGPKAARYERGNKRYWLMDITDEFLTVNASDLRRIMEYRNLARLVASGDRDAVKRAKAILGGGG